MVQARKLISITPQCPIDELLSLIVGGRPEYYVGN
jgi:hypothetical protein